MTTPMCEDGGPLREWAPLATLLQRIPVKVQSGIFTQDISFTCIDVLPEFIAVGTNHGIVYWYDRQTGDIERLRCENINASITCLRVISTVDYMVAAGNNQGIVTVFQIPKHPPDSLPDSLKPKQKKQVERYNIVGLHRNKVTAVEWSKNGMKLFSGDDGGLVVSTEIDFYMHLSKSFELLNEKYPVVQLSYQQGLLLVSTVFRTIIVDRNNDNKVSQIGQKERKTLGKLGAVFASRQNHVHEPLIYASRPGLRLWQANKEGTVLKTLVFKDAVKTHQQEVELLNPAPENAKKVRGEPSFGIVLPFFEDLLITYSEDIIYVVNPSTIAITSLITDLRHVTNVACTKDEIFVLEGERNIVRIAYYPETSTFASVSGVETSLDHPLASIAQISKPVTSGLLELTSKLKESAVVPAIPFHKIKLTNIIQSISALPIVSIGTDTTSVIKAEEAMEVPPVIPLDLTTSLITNIDLLPNNDELSKKFFAEEGAFLTHDRRCIFQKIGEQEFEDVVFTPGQKGKRSRVKVLTENDTRSSSPDDSEDVNPNINEKKGCVTKITHSSLLTLSTENSFMAKSERDLETIKKEVENKEKLLAGVLNFDLSEYMTSSKTCIESEADNAIDAVANVNDNDSTLITNGEIEMFDQTNIENENMETESIEEEEEEEEEENEDDESYKTEINKLRDLGECSKQLLRKKVEEPWISKNNNIDIGVEPSLMGIENVSEAEFNVLSKEFVTSVVTSVNFEEREGWIFLDMPSNDF